VKGKRRTKSKSDYPLIARIFTNLRAKSLPRVCPLGYGFSRIKDQELRAVCMLNERAKVKSFPTDYWDCTDYKKSKRVERLSTNYAK